MVDEEVTTFGTLDLLASGTETRILCRRRCCGRCRRECREPWNNKIPFSECRLYDNAVSLYSIVVVRTWHDYFTFFRRKIVPRDASLSSKEKKKKEKTNQITPFVSSRRSAILIEYFIFYISKVLESSFFFLLFFFLEKTKYLENRPFYEHNSRTEALSKLSM